MNYMRICNAWRTTYKRRYFLEAYAYLNMPYIYIYVYKLHLMDMYLIVHFYVIQAQLFYLQKKLCSDNTFDELHLFIAVCWRVC